MNDFLEIGKVIFFVVLGIVTILIAVLMAKGTPFLTKGMRKKYTEESVKNYCKNNCFAEIIFAMGAYFRRNFSRWCNLLFRNWLFIFGSSIYCSCF